jgi:hypothetical protein
VNRQTLDRIAVLVYAFVDWLVIMAPSLAIKLAAERGGLGDTKGVDLLVASAAIATPHAVVAARRLRHEELTAVRRADIWIASIDSLVVLALSTTLLVVTVLAFFADEHASLANRGLPVVILWIGIQLVAVALAEATGRFVFWWLEPHRPRRRRLRRPPPPASPAGPPAAAAADAAADLRESPPDRSDGEGDRREPEVARQSSPGT